eukprot:365048-Chlamydomonas_euryale.AAC.14
MATAKRAFLLCCCHPCTFIHTCVSAASCVDRVADDIPRRRAPEPNHEPVVGISPGIFEGPGLVAVGDLPRECRRTARPPAAGPFVRGAGAPPQSLPVITSSFKPRISARFEETAVRCRVAGSIAPRAGRRRRATGNTCRTRRCAGPGCGACRQDFTAPAPRAPPRVSLQLRERNAVTTASTRFKNPTVCQFFRPAGLSREQA